MVDLATITAAVTLTAAAILTTSVDAHPGLHQHHRSLQDITHARAFKHQAHRSLAACADSGRLRQLLQDAVARRQAMVRALRETQAKEQRQRQLAAADVLAKSHKSDLTGISTSNLEEVDPVALFGDTPTCVLEPEVTQGPYYVQGELIRNDIRESQAGVDLYAELQIIDVNTCEPVSDLYLDFWHCNATGVYSGVVAGGNGNQNDLTNINATFHRGLAPTDDDGLVQFVTKFPGHYTSRATHIHVLGSKGGQVLANNTYVGSTASHVGQLFFDQDLITAVEATGSYATNKQPVTTNAKDSIFAEETATGFDPVMQYVNLGESVEDGIFAWISIGIDATKSKTVTGAATLTANGGVANSKSGGGGGPGDRPGSGMGPPPDGSFPGSFVGPADDSSLDDDEDDASASSASSLTETPSVTTSAPSSKCKSRL